MFSNTNQYDEMHLAEKLNDASIDRLMAINTKWEIISWNKTAEIVSGIKKEEVLGKKLVELFPQLQQDTEVMQAFTMAFLGKRSFLTARPDMFNRGFYENHFIPLFDDNEDVIGVMNIMHDVSQRLHAERKLEQMRHELAEKYQLLNKVDAKMATFTAIIGKDIQEPLKKIYTSLEVIIMQDGARLSNSSKAGLRRIQATLNRTNLLLDDILSLSSLTSFNISHASVNLQQLIQGVIQSLDKKIKEKNVVIHVGHLPCISGSKQMLHSLFYNLLDNAIKFQPANNIPVIKISGNVVTENKKAGNAYHRMQYACISIVDNGIGFNQVDADKLFCIFVRLHPHEKYHGSGTGLTISQNIAIAHGGYITAEGEPDKGATFRCYLPLDEPVE